jgi:hypothetical protein
VDRVFRGEAGTLNEVGAACVTAVTPTQESSKESKHRVHEVNMANKKHVAQMRSKARARKREEKALEILAAHNKKKKKEVKVSKRKTFEDIPKLFPSSLYRPALFIRPPHYWISPSFNEHRQIADFVRWIYCKYPVPSFMFDLFFPLPTRIAQHIWTKEHDLFFDWFITIGQGGSFAKKTKTFFSKKEAHTFLNGRSDLTILENFWRAKCVANGGNERMATITSGKIHSTTSIYDHFWHSFFPFIGRFSSEIDPNDLNEIMDYMYWVRGHEVNYSFKGRTYNSVIKASNKWHKEMDLRSRGVNIPLVPAGIENFNYKDKKENCDWAVRQLLTSGLLYREGQKMHHCVGGYVSACRDGRSYIFSMTKSDGVNLDERELTIEVRNNGQISQARGRCNAAPTSRQKAILRRWAQLNNLILPEFI